MLSIKPVRLLILFALVGLAASWLPLKPPSANSISPLYQVVLRL
jgi:hypothetical protein